MDLKTLNRTLQFEFLNKHYLAVSKAENATAALKKVPSYQKLCALERELVFEVAKNKFNKKTNKELEQNLKLVREQKQAILEKLGIKKSDLAPKFECKICNDTGFAMGVMCECFKKRRNEELLKLSGLNLAKDTCFENFDTSICKDKKHADALEKLKSLLENWANNYPAIKKQNILISGTTGVGKTHICECLANKLAEKNYSICFVSAFDLNNMFLKYHTSFDQSKSSHLSPLIDSEFLFIDDLGTEPVLKNVTQNYLYLILSERERHKKPVIITTNLLPENILDRYGERIYSRLANKRLGFMVHIGGNDLRLGKD